MRLGTCALVFTLLAACGGGGEGDATPDADPAGQPAESEGGAVELGGAFAASVAEEALDVRIQVDSTRGVSRVMSPAGGTLTATATDGSKLKLTLPPNALISSEQITLAPVASISGLPPGVELAAAAQLGPEGLLLLAPATLSIEPAREVPRDSEVAFAWSGTGEDLHLYPPLPEPSGIEFAVMHFSGVGVATGSSEAAAAVIKGVPPHCAERYFRRIGEIVRARRSSVMAELGEAFVEISRSYVKNVLRPILTQARKDDTLLPCAASEFLAWQRQATLLLGDDFEAEFGQETRELQALLEEGLANAFAKAADRCARDESPLFQLQKMIGAVRQLELLGRGDLVPEGAMTRIQACARSLTYVIDVESTIENVYAEQGQGADVASSRTRVEARSVRVTYDETRSEQGRTPTFTTGGPVPLRAEASIVPRKNCPDEVRVSPGSTLQMTVTPILNPRIGRARCQGGKATCEVTDPNPGVLLQLAPHVVESTYLHTLSSAGCDPAGYWNEFMMFWMGGQSTGADQPFQVRGDQASVTVTRTGTGTRRMPIDVPPQMAQLQQVPEYVEVSLPAIETAREITRVNLRVQRGS